MFKKIPDHYLKKINTQCERIPTLYFHKNKVAQNFFWHRLEIANAIIEKNVENKGICLDFGCGNGVFLPTLSSIFQKVIAVDLETQETKQIIKKYNLKNVELITGDLDVLELPKNKFDLVVALDVLEHFKNAEAQVNKIKSILKKESYLITSLPTENLFTILTRKVSGQPKPFDHYHKGKDIEKMIKNKNFYNIDRKILNILYPMFYISLWKKI
ncbi:MAG: class I SAM-dependent methyltransferase [Patescibacteria group bacterium]